jgi:glutamyl-tRNA synthetase
VNAGQVIQLERKGFFRCDQPYGGPSKPIILFAIPDGKQKPGAAAAAPAPAAKGGKKK